MEEKNTNEVVNNNEIAVEETKPVEPIPVEPVTVSEVEVKVEETKTTEPIVQALPVEPVVQTSNEKENSNKPKKGNNFLIILLALIILGVGGYFVYDKFIASNEPNNEINENENNNESNNETENNNGSNNEPANNNDSTNEVNDGSVNNNTSEDVILTQKDCHDGDGCEFTKGKFNFKIVNLENESVTGEALYINGNKAIEDGWIIIDEDSILVLDDIAVVRVSEGLDHFSTFYIYDLQGKQLLNGKPIDSKFGTNMILDFWNDEPALSIEGNKIKIKASRFTHGPGILGETGPKGSMITENTSCDIIVMGTYEIEYYGNGKLSEIKNTSYITLKEAILNHGYSDYSNYVSCK